MRLRSGIRTVVLRGKLPANWKLGRWGMQETVVLADEERVVVVVVVWSEHCLCGCRRLESDERLRLLGRVGNGHMFSRHGSHRHLGMNSNDVDGEFSLLPPLGLTPCS